MSTHEFPKSQMYLEPAEEVGLVGRQPTVKKSAPLPCGLPTVPARSLTKREALGIYDAKVGGGKPVRLLKTMLTTACERNCTYCPFRAGRNYRRTTFKPDEMATTFMQLADRGAADGIFLSSGIIKGGVTTQDKLLDTVDIIRNKHGYRGYIHLKVMPGAERDQVARAMQIADRISVNLEAPTVDALHFLAPMKQLVEELFRPLKWVEEIRQSQSPRHTWNGRWPSTVTQFVVGAGDESDVDLLKTTQYLYNKIKLRRTYFSAFHPIHDTPLENHTAENPWREHRLYQASFLLRDYGFDLEELPFDKTGKLPLDSDPKLAWARQHLTHRPLELNHASKQQLMRVPGIGQKGADSIVNARRRGKIRSTRDLQKLGVRTKRLEPFVLLDGARPNPQLRLF